MSQRSYAAVCRRRTGCADAPAGSGRRSWAPGRVVRPSRAARRGRPARRSRRTLSGNRRQVPRWRGQSPAPCRRRPRWPMPSTAHRGGACRNASRCRANSLSESLSSGMRSNFSSSLEPSARPPDMPFLSSSKTKATMALDLPSVRRRSNNHSSPHAAPHARRAGEAEPRTSSSRGSTMSPASIAPPRPHPNEGYPVRANDYDSLAEADRGRHPPPRQPLSGCRREEVDQVRADHLGFVQRGQVRGVGDQPQPCSGNAGRELHVLIGLSSNGGIATCPGRRAPPWYARPDAPTGQCMSPSSTTSGTRYPPTT